MSSDTSIAGALAPPTLMRERPAGPLAEAGSSKQWDTAWQREMERVQAGTWFFGALPEGQAVAGLLAPARQPARDFEHRAEDDGARMQARSARGAGPAASGPSVSAGHADVARAAGTGEDRTGRAQAADRSAQAQRDGSVAPREAQGALEPTAPERAQASTHGSARLSLSAADAFADAVAAAERDAPAAQALTDAPAAAGAPVPVPAVAAPVAAPTAAAPGAPMALAVSVAEAPRAAQPLPQALAAEAATPKPTALAALGSTATSADAAAPTAAGAQAVADDGAPAAPASAGPRSLAAIERVLATAVGGSPGPRLHLSWDGQAVTVWVGVDGAVDQAQLLRTVQQVLRQQGLQLSALVCNGRTVVPSRAGTWQESNSAQQEN